MKKPIRIILLVCVSLIGISFGGAASRALAAGASPSPQPGFEAVVTGAFDGRVTGKGVLKLLPTAGFHRQGYYFLADGRGVRPVGVTFVLPRGVVPGKYALTSPSPLAIGTVASVRLDRDLGKSVLSFQRNTSGFLILTAFPGDKAGSGASEVTGSFAFETEDAKGKRVSVKGRFSFKAP